MAIWGEASYKVRRAITFHERFTVAELVDATDLAYAQVEQVVQRLIDKGYVHNLKNDELHEAERAVAKKVGRPRQRYTLTEDKAKREELYARVEAIASAERLSRATERKPSTLYFNRAMQLIEAMESSAEPPSIACLEEAAALLAYGRDFEGRILEGAEMAQAYYDLAQARLEARWGNYPKVEELLARAEGAFRAAGLDEQLQRSIDLRLALKVAQGFMEIKAIVERQADPMPALQDLRRVVYDFASPSYLLPPLQEAVEAIGAALGATMREIATLANTIATQQNTEALQLVAQAVERWTSEVQTGKELVEGAQVVGEYRLEGIEPLSTDMGIHITTEHRIEHIRIPEALLRELIRRGR